MGIMDLSMNQEEMGVQDRFGNQVFKLNKFDETDVKRNNNLYNSRKTDTEDSVSLFKDAYSSEHLQVDPSLFSYSSFKKAMDLRTHNRTDDEKRRTIFDDADYFARNFFYKLLPITFEQVDETIIHTEHNYSLFSLNSESDTEEDCSRTMDYSQIKKKNYKRRRTKFREGSSDETWCDEKDLVNYNENTSNQKPSASLESEPENAVQPLDLRTAPSVQEQKTDNHSLLKNYPIIREENLPSKLKCIQVTITRPDEKENYQPCDMFLNDIARLVPRLINNDCFEIDILDKTGDRHDDFQKHRLYYIIAESTWRLFQSTRERVILTNDHTLGPPVKKMEQDERPTFLVFDQFSLAKCLADYCEEIGGCFEYTRVEGRKEEEKEDVKHPKMIDMVTKVIEMNTNDEKTIDIKAAELKLIESNMEEIQMEESNVKLQNITAEEQTPDAKEFKMIDEGISSDNSGTETSEKPKKEDNFTETKNEKLEEETKAQERNIEEIEKVELKANENITNPMEEKEILKKMDAEDSSLKVYKRKMKINKNKIKKKETEKSTKKIGKFTISTKNIKSNKTCKRKAKAIDFKKEKIKASTSDDETKIFAVNAENMKPNDIGTKETKDAERKTNVKDTKVCEKQKAKTVALSFEETIKEDSKKPKSDDENMEKTTETEPQKRMIEATDTKKTKKLNRKTEKYREETKTSVTNAKEIKVGKGGKKHFTETKPNKGKEDESKSVKIVKNETSVQDSEISEKDIKTPRKGRKPNEQTEKVDQIKMKNKGKLIALREDISPLPKKTRNNMKSENKTPVLVPRVKTRSKSTSESDSSQKPNKVIKKSKITEKKPSAGFTRTKGSSERKTRSGKGTEERKQSVKVPANETSGRGLRGTKRKMVEEIASDERCLRPRGEKDKIENVGTFGKRRKR